MSRSFQITRALLVGLSLSLGFSSCDSKREESPSLLVIPDQSSELLSAKDSEGLTLLERVVAAPKRVAFLGQRRLTFAPVPTPPIDSDFAGSDFAGSDFASSDFAGTGDSEFSNPGHRTIYLEEVWADGQGSFTVTPLDLLEPRIPFDETEQFLLLQQQRERFLYLHRDFRIRDLALFRENWSLQIENDDAEFLGRHALIVSVRRVGDVLQDRSYRVTLDVETGLVLAYTELDERGRPVAVVEYESLKVGRAAKSGPTDANDSESGEGGESFTLASTVDEETGDDGASDGEGQPLQVEDLSGGVISEARAALLERGYRIPAMTPKGFRRMKMTVLTDQEDSRWLRLIYSDGVEELFIAIEFDRHPQSRVGIQEEVLAIDGHAGDVEAPREDWVEVFTSGNWSVAQGEFSASMILAVGKMHHRDLLATLQSARQ